MRFGSRSKISPRFICGYFFDAHMIREKNGKAVDTVTTKPRMDGLTRNIGPAIASGQPKMFSTSAILRRRKKIMASTAATVVHQIAGRKSRRNKWVILTISSIEITKPIAVKNTTRGVQMLERTPGLGGRPKAIAFRIRRKLLGKFPSHRFLSLRQAHRAIPGPSWHL